MTQTEHSRDAGVRFENAENATKTMGSARRENEIVSNPVERGRDAGVILGNTASIRQAGPPVRAEVQPASTQSEHARDGGVIFENAGSHRQAGAAPVVRKDEVTVGQRERSHDAGITFGTTGGDRQIKAEAARDDGSLWSLVESVLKLGEASVQFTLGQLQNGFRMLTDPGKAWRRVQHSMDNLSRAMNEPVEDARSRPGS